MPPRQRSALENWVAQMEPRREYARALQPRCLKSLISMDLVRYVVRSSCGVHSRILSAPIVDRLNAVSIRATLSVALAVCLIPIGTAQAELFGPQYRSWEGYDNAPFSPPDRSWGTGDYEPFRQKRQRAHTKHELRPKADPQRQRALQREESKPKTKTKEVAKGEPKANPRGRERPAPDHYLHRRSANFSLRRRHIDRPLFGINGSAGSSHARRGIQRHRQGTLASLKYLQCCAHALYAADHLVRDCPACRCLARPPGFTRLHSLGKRLCDSTLAPH